SRPEASDGGVSPPAAPAEGFDRFGQKLTDFGNESHILYLFDYCYLTTRNNRRWKNTTTFETIKLKMLFGLEISFLRNTPCKSMFL
ncbi:hypothetical protein KJ742_03565, partial [Patescibacteria group bacterium]|nr:hypothetical protein [Patescibacteria group bacterium]